MWNVEPNILKTERDVGGHIWGLLSPFPRSEVEALEGTRLA